MRTTLIIDDDLLRRAKGRAAAEDTTLSAIVNAALRNALSDVVVAAPPFRMPTFGPRKKRVHREPADFHREIEADDAASLRRR
jgi:hypothetical protein